MSFWIAKGPFTVLFRGSLLYLSAPGSQESCHLPSSRCRNGREWWLLTFGGRSPTYANAAKAIISPLAAHHGKISFLSMLKMLLSSWSMPPSSGGTNNECKPRKCRTSGETTPQKCTENTTQAMTVYNLKGQCHHVAYRGIFCRIYFENQKTHCCLILWISLYGDIPP